MAKYVCDFEKLLSTANDLIELSKELENNVNTYNTNINNNLSTWNGSAKSNFLKQVDNQVKISKSNASKVKAIGEYLKSSVNAIQELESDLSNLSI